MRLHKPVNFQNPNDAWCIPLAQGDGTVDVLILASESATGSEIPSTHTGLVGAVSSLVQSKLVDDTATYQTNGVAPGDIAQNTELASEAVVVSVDSETQLTLAADIFTAVGQAYALISLAEQVRTYIDGVRPVTASTMRVLAPTVLSQDVVMTVYGANIDLDSLEDDITDYLDAMEPGQDLTLGKLISMAMMADGVTDATVTTPAANVAPAADEMVRAGTVTVNLGA